MAIEVDSRQLRNSLRAALDPVFKPRGFRRIRSMGGYAKASGDLYTVVFFQLSSSNGPELARFTAEISQRCPEPKPGTGQPSVRLSHFFNRAWQDRFDSLSPTRTVDRNWFYYRTAEDIQRWTTFFDRVFQWALEQVGREERALTEHSGVTFRTGPVGREPYLFGAPARCLERYLAFETAEYLGQTLGWSESQLESLKPLLKSGLTRGLEPLPLDWPGGFACLGIVLSDNPPRPRLVNSGGTDVAQVVLWDREVRGYWPSFQRAHPHLSLEHVLAARLFARVYAHLLTTSGRK